VRGSREHGSAPFLAQVGRHAGTEAGRQNLILVSGGSALKDGGEVSAV
jgi:hypothetical protein